MSVDWVSKAEGLTLQVRDYIEGSWCSGENGTPTEKYNPRDGELLCRFSIGDLGNLEEAVAKAKQAFEDGRWWRRSAASRQESMQRLAALLEKHRDSFALLECLDVGKPISDALRFDVPTAAAIIRYNAEAIGKNAGKIYGIDESSVSYQLLRPVGVVAGIIGWNFPLILAVQKLGPALAAGNCLVLKPSEMTCFSAARLAELAVEAGIPEGVFNVIHGPAETGAALARHPQVDLITFTGSSRGGKQLLIAAGESNMKRLILECGGKAPNVVFEDCPDLESVAEGIVTRAFWNQGQVCTASSRLLIQNSIKRELLRIVIEKTAALRPGDPLKAETTFGALVSHAHQCKVLKYIDRGRTGGAKVVHQSGFALPHERGFYVQPVIFDEVAPGHIIAQEEIFGPVLSVFGFNDEEEAIRISNDSAYGLSAIVWTKDLGRAHRVSRGIRAGWIVINGTAEPMGGPGEGVLPVGGLKESGLGIEGGLEGLESYMTRTAVQIFV